MAASDANQAVAGCPAGQAGAVDRIVFALPTLPATIPLESKLQLAGNLEIVGPGASQLTISGSSTTRIFEALNGTIAISDLTVANGRAAELGGGMFVQSPATVGLARVVLRNNEVEATPTSERPRYAAGGAVLNEGNLTLTESTVTGNVTRNAAPGAQVHSLGGGIANGEGRLLLDRSTVSGNAALVTESPSNSTARGGGIYNLARMTVRASTVSGNELRVKGSPTNSALGGGIAFETEGPKLETTIERSTIVGNSAAAETLSQGGGLAGLGLPATVKSSTIAANSAATGANVFARVAIGFTDTIVARPLVGPSCVGTLASTASTSTKARAAASPRRATRATSTHGSLPPLPPTKGRPKRWRCSSGSPAIDRGIATGETTDQRGLKRPVDVPGVANATGGDGSDIGALRAPGRRAAVEPAEDGATARIGKLPRHTTKRRLKIRFSSSEAGSSFECRLDKRKWRSCRSPYRTPKLKLGKHFFKVRAIGTTGLVSPKPAKRHPRRRTAPPLSRRRERR